MASTYSTNLAIELIGTGDQAGTWGNTTNTNLGTLIEQAISGYVTQAVSTGTDTTITIPNGATGVARNMYIELTGTGGTNTNLIVPANKKLYFIFNNTSSGQVTVKVSGQTGVSVPNKAKVILVSNGTDIIDATNYIGSAVIGNITATSGTITTLASTSAIITTLTSTSAGITTLSSGSANITQLNSTSGTISTLASTSAAITTLSGTTLTYSSASITNLTATSLVLSNLSIASANITTLTSSSATISTTLALSGGTANGVLYLNGSKVATSGSALVFDGADLGVGRTPNDFSGITATAPILDVDGTIQVRSSGGINLGGGTWRKAAINSPGGTDTPYLAFSTATSGASSAVTERLRIDNSGNVGIGTSSPAYKLEVSAATDIAQFIATDAGASGAQIQLFHDSASPANDDVTSLILFAGRDSAAQGTIYSRISGISTNVTNGSESGAIAFSTRNLGTFAERMRLTSAGELLVGGTTAIENATAVTIQNTNATAILNLFSNDTSISDGNFLGAIRFFGNDTTSNTPTELARIGAAASGTHAAGDNPTDLVFRTTPDGTETVAEAGRITQAGSYVLKGGTTTAAAGVGIIFPATQVASANANSLDEYEEGTFTPRVIGSTTEGTGTYTTQVGRYVKIGKFVHVQINLVWTASTGTGNLRFSGLPFTSVNVANANSAASIGQLSNIALTAGNVATAYINTNSTDVVFEQYATGGGASAVVPIDTAGSVILTATYEANT